MALTASSSSCRILYTDDTEFYRISVPAMLTKLGYTVLSVESAKRALEIIAKDQNFFSYLTDYHMPKMNGASLIRKLQESGINGDFVLHTSDSYDDVAEVIDSLKIRYLQKPATREQFIQLYGRVNQ
ncbi:MAG: response regulator [Chlamydiales bacterium]|nr:response regulator [Chlamydiales bacterium]